MENKEQEFNSINTIQLVYKVVELLILAVTLLRELRKKSTKVQQAKIDTLSAEIDSFQNVLASRS